MDKLDRLFLEKDCPKCGQIRAALDMEAVCGDEKKGKEGQGIVVLAAMSNAASIDLLDKYGMSGKGMPLLLTHEGKTIDDPKVVLWWLKQHGFAK